MNVASMYTILQKKLRRPNQFKVKRSIFSKRALSWSLMNIPGTLRIVHPDSTILRRIGIRLKELRLSQKLTQQELSERCLVHRKFISMVERGTHNVSILTLCQIIHALGGDFVSFIRDLERNSK